MQQVISSSDRPEQTLDSYWLLKSLREDQRISEAEFQRATTTKRNLEQVNDHPITYLASLSLQDASQPRQVLNEEQLLYWLGKKTGQPFYDIDPLKINVPAITAVMSYEFAQRHKIMAVEVSKESVTIASSEPFIQNWLADLEHILRRPVKRVLVSPVDLKRYTIEFYSLAKSVKGASGQSNNSNLANFEQLVQLGAMQDPDANDQHIVNIVDWLFQYAFDQRASDIHIEPRREITNVRFRIDGVLYYVYELPAAVGIAVTSRLKILGRLDVAEKRRPQDGRIKTITPDGHEIELRLSTLPTAFGEKMVMRIFDPDVLLRSFDELGLSSDDLKRWQGFIQNPNGIVLVTGPTGSGKTTTLYSSLKQLATSAVNVCTIEDPIEMVEEQFNQMQVQHAIDLDFANGVRSLMRQDPDIIMVGEIRDLETAEMAIQAALTGHLVLSTLHTNDAPSALTRLLELGVPGYLIKATVLGVMAQRLVRTLCQHCKTPDTITDETWQQLVKPWKVNKPAQVYKPVGCLECRNTGYRGRQGIYEIMPLSSGIHSLIKDDIEISDIRHQAMREGMHTLRLSGAQKIAAGLTTMEEVMRVVTA